MTDPQAIADTLIEAEQTRTPIRPFTRIHFFLDADTAYRAQALFVDHRLRAGEHLIGAKLGLTSRVKREALGIDEPVFGRLTSGMLLASSEPVPLDQLIRPRAEPEIAFLMGRRLEGPVTSAGVLAATEAVVAAIEVMDSRYSDRFRLPDSIADNAGAARIVLGSRPRSPGELCDLRLIGCVFRSGGRVVGTAAGGAVMGDPAAAVAWLVNTLAARDEHLPAGSVALGRTHRFRRPTPRCKCGRRVRRTRLGRGAQLRRSVDACTRLGTSLLTTVANVEISPYDVAVQVRDGETLLRAICRSGYKYRYGCRRGGCGFCKVHLVLGEVTYERPIDSRVLTDDEKRSGICLSCRAVPLTNVVIELQEGDRLGGIPQTDGPAVSRKRMKR